MIVRLLAAIVLICCVSCVYAAEPVNQDLAPLPAAEAEQREGDARDALTDLLWTNTEGHWHNGRWDEAIRLCRQIVQIDPQFVEAYNGAAWMLWSMEEDEAAIELYEAGVAANPDTYEIYHDYGMYYYHEKDYEKAAEQFRKSVENNAPAYYQHMLPNSLERAGRAQEALEEWQALLKRFPNDPIAVRHIRALEEQLAE